MTKRLLRGLLRVGTCLLFIPLAQAQEVRVSGFVAQDVGVWNSSLGGTAFITLADVPMCAWKENLGNNRYWVQIDDGTNDGTLNMDDGLGNTIQFQLRWATAAGGYANVVEGVAKRYGAVDKNTGANDCSLSADSAKLQIRMRQNWPSGNPPGIYHATVNVLVYPD
ncbi:MAG: hypothetical protein GC134_07220 [Proteobacteria bacterium]|nr:hypothetical protein [Pseudomonadota bacterium]